MADNSQTPKQVLEFILAERGGQRVHRAPLYTLKIAADEFEELQATLRRKAREIGPRRPDECAALVLFAAETLCRDYDGGSWSWEPVWRRLGVQLDCRRVFYPALRAGLKYWGLNWTRFDTGRHAYLMTLALQGGLPRKMLTAGAEGGPLGRFLARLLRRHERFPYAEIVDLAQELAGDLPSSLRHPQLYRLTAKLVLKVAELRRKVTGSPDWRAALERDCPTWRDMLPLHFDSRDESVERLIGQLIEDALCTTEGSGAVPNLHLELNYRAGSAPRVERWLSLPRDLDVRQLWTVPEGDRNATVPRYLNLFLRDVDGGEERVGEASLAVDGKHYRVRPSGSGRLSGPKVFSEQRLIVSATGQLPQTQTLCGGCELLELPWSFEETVDEGRYREVGVASARTGGESLWVVLPATVRLEGAGADQIADCAHPPRKVWRLSTSSTLGMNGEIYELSLRNPSAAQYTLRGAIAELEGPRGMHWSRCPQLIMRADEEECFETVPQHELEWRSAAPGSSWGPIESPLGDGYLRRVSRGVTLYRMRLSILPADLRVSVQVTEARGKVSIESRDLRGVECEDFEAIQEEGQGHFSIEAVAGSVAYKQTTTVACLRFGDRTSTEVRLPIPVRQVAFLDAGDRLQDRGALVSIDELLRLRAVDLGGPRKRASYVDAFLEGERDPVAFLPLTADEVGRRVARLDGLREVLRTTIALDASHNPIDHEARLELKSDGRPAKRLRVRHYSISARRQPGTSLVTPMDERSQQVSGIPELQAEMVPTWRPQSKPTALAIEEGNAVLPITVAYPGWYLVHLHSSDPYQTIRPVAVQWGEQGEEGDAEAPEAPHGLLERSCRAPFEELEGTLKSAIEEIVGHGWHESMAGLLDSVRTMHKWPAATLRTNTCMIRNADAMARIALELCSERDFEGIWQACEELAFSWSCVPLAAWRRALKGRLERVPDEFKKDARLQVLGDLVRRIAHLFCGVDVIALLLAGEDLVAFMDTGVLTRTALGTHELRGKLHGVQQALSHRAVAREAAGDAVRDGGLRWPQRDLRALAKSYGLREAFAHECALLESGFQRFKDTVLDAPALATVAVVYLEQTPDRMVHTIKFLRAFDARAFDEAFALHLAHLLNDKDGPRPQGS